jgi:hypothetical protein
MEVIILIRWKVPNNSNNQKIISDVMPYFILLLSFLTLKEKNLNSLDKIAPNSICTIKKMMMNPPSYLQMKALGTTSKSYDVEAVTAKIMARFRRIYFIVLLTQNLSRDTHSTTRRPNCLIFFQEFSGKGEEGGGGEGGGGGGGGKWAMLCVAQRRVAKVNT